MEVCAASVQGAVVPGSEYAFAALACDGRLSSKLCVLPDIPSRLPEPSVSRHTSTLSHDQVAAITPRWAAFRGQQLRFAVAF